MKKTTMMRIASTLLVAVLVTTCAIGATFAKYTVADGINDDARVAKWGVVVTARGSLFEDAYDLEPVDYTTNETVETISVQAAAATNLVAPYTKNSTGMTFVITGTPEVDTQVTVTVTVNNDVKLAAKTYADNPTTGATIDEYVLANDYMPVKFTLKNGAGETLVYGNLSDIEEFLESLTGRYNTNTDLATIKTVGEGETAVTTDGTYKLTWEWETTNDVADTILGNAAVSTIEGATTAIDFDISIEVTQVN